MLAHWARTNKFEGIVYTSTRVDQSKWTMRGYLRLNRYRENVAFFTNYDPTSRDDHDLTLLERFEISPPIQAHEAKDVAAEVLKDYRTKILRKGNAQSISELAQKAAVDIDIAFEGLVHLGADGKETPYNETSCGRLQRYLQYLFMTRQLVDNPGI